MLVLRRNKYEKIEITVPPSTTPTKIMVVVVGVNDYNAKIGIEAERHVQVLREEAIVRIPHESHPSPLAVPAVTETETMVQPSQEIPAKSY